jgi:hypothetical protein
MKRSIKIAIGVSAVAGFGFAVAAAFAHPEGVGPGMMMHETGMPMMGAMHGPMAAPMQHGDEAFAADMQLVQGMVHNNDKIKRTVTNLPDGIGTVTESDDPKVAEYIKAHVASMQKRLDEGRVFNLFSPTLPTLFAKKDKIKTTVETTGKGVTVTQTSSDPEVVAALQAHAVEVSELARDGMVAMMRGMRARMMGRADSTR